MGYGYTTDESNTGSSLKFGLNQNVFLKEFSYTNEEGSEYIKLVLNVEDRDVQIRKYKIERVFGKDNNEITDPINPAFKQAEADLSAWVVHILNIFYEPKLVKSILSKEFTSFEQYAKTVTSMVEDSHKEIPLDLFLQYQWQIKGDANMTFLSIPSKMKYGKWLCKHIDGNFVEEITDKGLKYISDDRKTYHPFKRNKWFMDSNFAKQQFNEESTMEFPPAGDNSSQIEEKEPEW